MMQRASGMWVLVRRGRRVSLLLAWGRSKGLLLHNSFKGKAATIRAMARAGPLARRADDVLSLSLAWTLKIGLPLEARIPECWDTIVPVISGTPIDTVCSFFPRCGS